MNRHDVDWKGYWVATPTPFGKDLEFDEKAFRQLLGQYISQGVHGLLINGGTGEWFSQTAVERRRVAEVAVEEVAGRIPVVIGCTYFTPAVAIDLAEHARSIGAAGAMAATPPYVHPNDRELVNFFRVVSEAVDIPWMVYNWPIGTGIDISIGALAQIADLDRVVALKESTPNELKCAEACEAVVHRLRVFGRFIHPRGLAIYREIGGDGNIDGGGLGAQFAVPYFEALWIDDLGRARELGAKYANLAAKLVDPDYSGKFGSATSQLKAAMNLLGQPGGRVRLPLMDIEDDVVLRGLRAALKAGGLAADGGEVA